MPPNMFDSFAGFFSEPTTGFCPQYDIEKAPIEEIIDVSKEMNEETLKEIADKALMGKLKEVETESVETESVETKMCLSKRSQSKWSLTRNQKMRRSNQKKSQSESLMGLVKRMLKLI
ncbi:hypothetical protein Hanom_Chr11g01000251 [Helianthus anomalus]